MSIIKVDYGDAPSITLAPELIWANPDITVALGAITINENTAGWVSGKHWEDYDGFIIGARDSNNASTKQAQLIFITKDITTVSDSEFVTEYSATGAGGNTFSSLGLYGRGYTILSDGISIDASYGYQSPYCVPWYIWGVKGQLTVD